MKHALVLSLLVLAASSAFAQRIGRITPPVVDDTKPATQPASQPSEAVKPILAALRKIQPPKYETADVLKALTALGKDGLPGMKEAREMGDKLVGDDELTTNTYTIPGEGTIVDGASREERVRNLADIRTQTLDKAIVQVGAGFDPIKKLNEYAATRKGEPEAKKLPFEPTYVGEPALGKVFPKTLWYSMIMRQGPVIRINPKGEQWPMHNVFVLDAKGKVTHFDKVEQLKEYFTKHAPALKNAKDEDTAKEILTAWLAVGPVFENDGYYQFEVGKGFDVAGADHGFTVTGKAEVPQSNAVKGGNAGWVQAVMTFEKGKMTDVTQTAELRKGMRPRCQSTLLLDKNPLIRYMAWQELRVMGRLAEDYLKEMRPTLSPELQKEVDRLWQQILEDERKFGK